MNDIADAYGQVHLAYEDEKQHPPSVAYYPPGIHDKKEDAAPKETKVLKNKCVCTVHRCTWRGTEDMVLEAPNPFNKDDVLVGCPKCRMVDTIVTACDEEGCWEEASCGTPTKMHGYRCTCSKHYPEDAI